MTTCWGITSGQAGMIAQVKALAATINIEPEMKRIDIHKAVSWIPNLVFDSPLCKLILPFLLAPGSDSVAPPYPDIVISCGRRAALVAMALKKEAPNTRFVHIQDPHTSFSYYDLIVAMEHDYIDGDNIISTKFALHSITPELLEQARQKFESKFALFHEPRVAVLLGGSTNKYKFSPLAMKQVTTALHRFLENTQASLLITPSRRTGKDNIAKLRKSFETEASVYIYNMHKETENPYFGLLALADVIIVSNDSVNMMSEACATGKPIYILPLPGHKNTKPARFAEQLVEQKIARILGTSIKQWKYPIPDEMEKVAAEVRKRLL